MRRRVAGPGHVERVGDIWMEHDVTWICTAVEEGPRGPVFDVEVYEPGTARWALWVLGVLSVVVPVAFWYLTRTP